MLGERSIVIRFTRNLVGQNIRRLQVVHSRYTVKNQPSIGRVVDIQIGDIRGQISASRQAVSDHHNTPLRD